MERRRLEKMGVAPSVNYKVQVEEEVHEEEEGDGYEADAEDLEDDSLPESGMPNGFQGYRNQVDEYDDDDDDGEMMDLD